MTDELKKDLTKVLQGFLFEEFNEVQKSIAAAIEETILRRGHVSVGVDISPLNDCRGVRAIICFDDTCYSCELLNTGVSFNEINPEAVV